jgi:hypothetical protein
MPEVGAVDPFSGKLAVVTGCCPATGCELVRRHAVQVCPVAACGWHAVAVAETAALARVSAPAEASFARSGSQSEAR